MKICARPSKCNNFDLIISPTKTETFTKTTYKLIAGFSGWSLLNPDGTETKHVFDTIEAALAWASANVELLTKPA